jgi:hypothetical protein
MGVCGGRTHHRFHDVHDRRDLEPPVEAQHPGPAGHIGTDRRHRAGVCERRCTRSWSWQSDP